MKHGFTHRMEYDSKLNGILIYVTTWINLENTTK
jgi:hypothetical protein